MKLITYGCGNKFDLSKFNKIQNYEDWNKPCGGLWSSPIDSEFSWIDYIKERSFDDEEEEDEDYSDLPGPSFFEFSFNGKIKTIDTKGDIVKLPWIKGEAYANWTLDFESLISKGFDALHLTAKGEKLSRYIDYPNFMGWDCESILIFNPETINAEVHWGFPC